MVVCKSRSQKAHSNGAGRETCVEQHQTFFAFPPLETHDRGWKHSTSPVKSVRKEHPTVERRDASYDQTSKTCRPVATNGTSVEYFGVPTIVELCSFDDISEISDETFKLGCMDPCHPKPIVNSSFLAKGASYVKEDPQDWPSDEESQGVLSAHNESNNSEVPIAEQAAAFFVGDEPFKCDLARHFHCISSQKKQHRSRRSKKKHGTTSTLCWTQSRDDRDDTSLGHVLSSACSSYDDERETVPLIQARPTQKYRLV